MLNVASICFGLAALLGVILLYYVLKDKETPKGLAFIHGPLAAAGIIILIIYAIQTKDAPLASIILFTTAALGGIIMIVKDLKGKKVPKLLAIAHGLIAATAFLLLILFINNR